MFGLGTLYGTEHPWFWRIHITAIVLIGENIRFESSEGSCQEMKIEVPNKMIISTKCVILDYIAKREILLTENNSNMFPKFINNVCIYIFTHMKRPTSLKIS